jgi:hypothetical protein
MDTAGPVDPIENVRLAGDGSAWPNSSIPATWNV